MVQIGKNQVMRDMYDSSLSLENNILKFNYGFCAIIISKSFQYLHFGVLKSLIGMNLQALIPLKYGSR
jgi:hypothetical protein